MIMPKSNGKCYVNHEKKKFWIDIPKCASKTISFHLFNEQGYVDGNFLQDKKIQEYECSAVIRDPVERWYAGALEICYHYKIRWPDDEAMFNHRFDYFNFRNFEERENEHLNPQSSFFDELNLDNVHFILLDENFERNVKSYYDIKGDLHHANKTVESQIKKKISQDYIWEIYTDDSFQDKLREYYKKDYELIDYIMERNA